MFRVQKEKVSLSANNGNPTRYMFSVFKLGSLGVLAIYTWVLSGVSQKLISQWRRSAEKAHPPEWFVPKLQTKI